VRVKICGITRAADAVLAAELGAWAIGFIFWEKSPRYVRPETAGGIVRALPGGVMTVGVFVDQPIEFVTSTAASIGLSAVQLHGAERPAYAREIARPVIKALSVDQAADTLDQWDRDTLVLLDAPDPIRRGGTGRTIDWTRAAAVARRRSAILSGGLRPENVRRAAGAVRPFAIDVSSGVESAPGLKDAARLRALFAALQGMEASS
jgi:phosphoribosylanthranilate isomerase